MICTIKEYELGDMTLIYFMEEDTLQTGMYLIPKGMKPIPWEEKKQSIDSLIQIKYAGDTYPGGYAGGETLRQGESALMLRYQEQELIQEQNKIEIITRLTDARGNHVAHHALWYKGEKSIELFNEVTNKSEQTITLEMISSFSLGGLTPFTPGDAHETLQVHRIRSVWSMEGRVDTQSVEGLQLEPAWSSHAVRCERFGQKGSMPVNHYFPFVAVEDIKNNIIWAAQIAHNASWQIELYRKDDGLAVSGGLADRDFGQWNKDLRPGDHFITPKAIVSVCAGGGLDEVSQRITNAGKKYFDKAPESEQTLPVIFNEYCTTWGCPSHENICQILNYIKNKGFDYFVIDCGWFKEDGIPWDISMGDYDISKELFPEGLQKTIDAIKNTDLKPGIWFEIDNVGSASRAYHMEEHLLKRDGKVLTTSMRRFWDMRQEWVMSYLNQRVTELIKEYRIEYVKMDYNDSIGMGCDGAESPGEALRQNMEASLEFIRNLKREVPGLILENCASGGHKLEPLLMSECSMASFSDAHECEEIPIIAANLHRTILPSQSQIWCVIREEDSLKRIAYSIINTFLGRMCLSGDVMQLDANQWDLIERGIQFYKKIAPIIKDGFTYFYGPKIQSYRHPKGWQAILRTGNEKEAVVIIHTFYEEPEKIELSLDQNYQIIESYSDTDVKIWIEDSSLYYIPESPMKAVALRLEKISS